MFIDRKQNVLILSAACLAALLLPATGWGRQVTSTRPAPLPFTGVNLAGGEFYQPKPGVRPKADTDFGYPTAPEFDYFAAKGMNLYRVQFLWETLQPEARKPFDTAEMQRLKAVVKGATARKLVVILDPHNYARYYGKVVGGPEVSAADFADFWKRLAAEFADDPFVWFGLVNEPNSMPTKQWFDDANAAIAAIRGAGATNLILIPGNAWTGAHSWQQDWYGESNASHVKDIVDPLNYWVIEVHQYLDADSSGTKPTVVSPTIGSERLKAFVEWARANKVRAVLGEFAVPVDTEGKAEPAIADMLASMERDRDVWLGWTWWAAGPRWGDYMFTLEPKEGKDRPQMAWVAPHLHGSKTLPTFSLAVKGGTGTGSAAAGQPRAIAASAPKGMVFQKWTGDTAWLKDTTTAKTTVTMPYKDIRLEAVFVRRAK